MSALLLTLTVLATVTGRPAQAWPPAVTALSNRVSHVYRGAHVRIVHAERTQTEGTSSKPMYLITLSGTFHRGRRTARTLSFSALANRSYIWGIVARDGANHVAWIDPVLPHVRAHYQQRYDNVD